jgi:hypothetical protein
MGGTVRFELVPDIYGSESAMSGKNEHLNGVNGARNSWRCDWPLASFIGLVLAASVLGVGPSGGDYDVVWNSPSENSSGSMPIGNGDIGLNLWVNPAGELVFYISKTDAWSENARLLKLGLVRVKLSPGLWEQGLPSCGSKGCLFARGSISAKGKSK